MGASDLDFLFRDTLIENQLKLDINQQLQLVKHLQEAVRVEQTKLGNMLRESMKNILIEKLMHILELYLFL